jgi:uncharacterized protein YggE
MLTLQLGYSCIYGTDMKRFFYALAFLFASQTSASTLPDFPFVTVTGESSRSVSPDEATMRFSLITFHKRAEVAKKQLDQASENTVNTLLSFDIKKEDIVSYEVNKRVKRKRGKDYNDLDILGYEFTQSFEVTLIHLDNYSDLSHALLKAEHVQGINSQFDYSKRDNVEVELITEAARKAKQKAENMATGLGVSIGSVFAFNDSGSFNSFFASFGLSDNQQALANARFRSAPPSSQLFIPQYIEIKKSINVIYKIED